MQTVPAGTATAAGAASAILKRIVPDAAAAAFRERPRISACLSRYSPAAVCGKHCPFTQSA